MEINLRQYQIDAIEQLDQKFREEKRRIVLYCATGGGKTTICAWMVKRALGYSYPVIFVVRGRELVKNASETLDKFKIDHSINMAGHWRYNQSKLAQICSIDTLKSRKNFPFLEKEPLIFIDEAHKDYADIFAYYPNAYIIGLTGTPFTDMSAYQDYVMPIENYELRDQGFLVPEKIYCPHVIDVTAVKKVRGDFDRKQLESVVTQSAIVGNIVEDWKKYGQNRPTVCFAVSIEHSLQLKQAFNDAGIPAVHCDANSDDKERKNAKDWLISGRIKVVTNVDIFSVGWDCPVVACIILARPTWSLTWMLQAIGRGLRSCMGKHDCIILDNAGNVFRHGTPYRIREISFEKPDKKKKQKMDNKVATCEDCYFVFDPEEYAQCPECGWEKPKKIRVVKNIDGSLTEFVESEEEEKERLFKMMRADYYKLEWVRKTKKLHPNWSFIQLKKKYPKVFHMMDKITVVPTQFQEDHLGQLYY